MTTIRIPLGQRTALFTGARRVNTAVSDTVYWQVDISTYRPMVWWVKEADVERLNPGIVETLFPVQTCAVPPAQVISLFDVSMVEVAA